MEEDLVARLLANAPLAALVGNRITWLDRPQGSGLPAITLQVITPGRSYHFKGPAGYTGARVQADSWGAFYLSAKQASRAFLAAIEPPALFGSTRFGPAFLEGGPDFPPQDIDGGGRAYRVNHDIIIWHRPA